MYKNLYAQGYTFCECLTEIFDDLSRLYRLQPLWDEAVWLSMRTGALTSLLDFSQRMALPPRRADLKQVALHLTEVLEHCPPGTYWGVLPQHPCHLLFFKSPS